MFEIGNSLREARVRQGLDHSQVELATKIRAKYIRALEEEQFEFLPVGTYIKGFLRSYAEFLGLDGQLYVDEYNSRNAVDGFDDMPQRRPRIRQERALERRVVVLALFGIAALTALVIVAWKFGGGDGSGSAPPILTQKQKPAAPKGLRFVGLGKGTYLEVRRTSSVGRVVFQGTLRPGDREFIVGTRFWLAVRRPAGVRFTLAGKPLALPAHRNLRVRVTPTKTDRVSG
jgi:cytoskeleton protein RodZ